MATFWTLPTLVGNPFVKMYVGLGRFMLPRVRCTGSHRKLCQLGCIIDVEDSFLSFLHPSASSHQRTTFEARAGAWLQGRFLPLPNLGSQIRFLPLHVVAVAVVALSTLGRGWGGVGRGWAGFVADKQASLLLLGC